jgi:hypothetical protein
MASDPLGEWLRRADAAAGLPLPIQADLAERVRHQARRRRTTRAAAGAAAMVLLAVGAVWALWPLIERPTGNGAGPIVAATAEQAEIARLQEKVHRLQEEVQWRTAAIERTLTLETQQRRLAELRRRAAEPDALDRLDQQTDQTAFTIIYQADRMYKELGLEARAVEDYRRVIRLFPETRWAEVARKRLSEIEGSEKGSRDKETIHVASTAFDDSVYGAAG